MTISLVGKVMYFKVVNNQVTVIYVKFNDVNAGLMTMQSGFAHQQHWVPIRKLEVSLDLKKISLNHALRELSFH